MSCSMCSIDIGYRFSCGFGCGTGSLSKSVRLSLQKHISIFQGRVISSTFNFHIKSIFKCCRYYGMYTSPIDTRKFNQFSGMLTKYPNEYRISCTYFANLYFTNLLKMLPRYHENSFGVKLPTLFSERGLINDEESLNKRHICLVYMKF